MQCCNSFFGNDESVFDKVRNYWNKKPFEDRLYAVRTILAKFEQDIILLAEPNSKSAQDGISTNGKIVKLELWTDEVKVVLEAEYEKRFYLKRKLIVAAAVTLVASLFFPLYAGITTAFLGLSILYQHRQIKYLEHDFGAQKVLEVKKEFLEAPLFYHLIEVIKTKFKDNFKLQYEEANKKHVAAGNDVSTIVAEVLKRRREAGAKSLAKFKAGKNLENVAKAIFRRNLGKVETTLENEYNREVFSNFDIKSEIEKVLRDKGLFKDPNSTPPASQSV